MIYTRLNRTCEIESVKAHGEGDVAEVYGSINELNPIYYKTRTLTGTLPLSYKALGKPLSDYLISGNTIQNGTPTPSDPVDVVGCGVWDETQQSYKLPITVNSTEYPIYLGQVPTVRRIRKLALTGKEGWEKSGTTLGGFYNAGVSDYLRVLGNVTSVCTHYSASAQTEGMSGVLDKTTSFYGASQYDRLYIRDSSFESKDDFKSYLAAQYAAGTPVTVWYVLAEPETGIVNEPLHKIGDYADTVSMTQDGVTIPTVAGANTLTIDTTVQPSAVSITGNIKEVSG